VSASAHPLDCDGVTSRLGSVAISLLTGIFSASLHFGCARGFDAGAKEGERSSGRQDTQQKCSHRQRAGGGAGGAGDRRLVGAGLLVRTLQNLRSIDVGSFPQILVSESIYVDRYKGAQVIILSRFAEPTAARGVKSASYSILHC